VTYEVRKFPAIFIVVVLKIQWSLVRIYNEINVGNKTKTFKRHLDIIKIYSMHYNLKKYSLLFWSLHGVLVCMSSLRVFLSLWISPYNKQNIKLNGCEEISNGFMFSCQKQNLTRELLFLPLEHKIHISSQPSNILYLWCTQIMRVMFCVFCMSIHWRSPFPQPRPTVGLYLASIWCNAPKLLRSQSSHVK
jgi:hypothetical protein